MKIKKINEIKELMYAERFEEAMIQLEQLIQVYSEDKEMLNIKGFLLNQTKEYKEAQEVLEKAINLGATDPKIFNNLGIALEEQGLKNDAKLAFTKALSLNKNNLYAYFNLASYYIKEHQFKSARQILVDAKGITKDKRIKGFYLESFLTQYRLIGLIAMIAAVIFAILLKYPFDFLFIIFSAMPLFLASYSDYLRGLKRKNSSLLIAIAYLFGIALINYSI